MEEPRMPQEQEELGATTALPAERLPEPPPDLPEPVVDVLEEPPGSANDEPVGMETVLGKVEHEVNGLTVSDGFRFGCGFVLALAIGTLAFLVVMTAFLAVGAFMGFKLPI